MTDYPGPIRITTTAANHDRLIAECWRLGPLGVEDRDGELVASFATDAETDAAIDHLRGWTVVERFDANPEQWRNAWQQHAHAVEVAGWTIRPPWIEGSADDLVIDATDAFGHGGHVTTRLILEALAGHAGRVDHTTTVLDVGTGSGVLAIAAMRLGASAVDAIDVDPDAVTSAITNAELNGFSTAIAASGTPLESIDQSYGLVLANLPSPTIVDLAPQIENRVADGGLAILSGFLTSKKAAVLHELQALQLQESKEHQDWCTLILSR